jgi:hypothetical protein
LAGCFFFPLDFLPGCLPECLGGGEVTEGLFLALDRVDMTTASLMVAKYLSGSRSVLRHTQATCDPPGELNLESYFLSDLQIDQDPTGVLFGPP